MQEPLYIPLRDDISAWGYMSGLFQNASSTPVAIAPTPTPSSAPPPNPPFHSFVGCSLIHECLSDLSDRTGVAVRTNLPPTDARALNGQFRFDFQPVNLDDDETATHVNFAIDYVSTQREGDIFRWRPPNPELNARMLLAACDGPSQDATCVYDPTSGAPQVRAGQVAASGWNVQSRQETGHVRTAFTVFTPETLLSGVPQPLNYLCEAQSYSDCWIRITILVPYQFGSAQTGGLEAQMQLLNVRMWINCRSCQTLPWDVTSARNAVPAPQGGRPAAVSHAPDLGVVEATREGGGLPTSFPFVSIFNEILPASGIPSVLLYVLASYTLAAVGIVIVTKGSGSLMFGWVAGGIVLTAVMTMSGGGLVSLGGIVVYAVIGTAHVVTTQPQSA